MADGAERPVKIAATSPALFFCFLSFSHFGEILFKLPIEFKVLSHFSPVGLLPSLPSDCALRQKLAVPDATPKRAPSATTSYRIGGDPPISIWFDE